MSLLENHISRVSDTFDGLCGKGDFPAGTLILGAWTKIFGLTDFPSTYKTETAVLGASYYLHFAVKRASKRPPRPPNAPFWKQFCRHSLIKPAQTEGLAKGVLQSETEVRMIRMIRGVSS